MSKTYRYMSPRAKSLVYANTVNVMDQLAITHAVLTPKSIGVDIHRNTFALNLPYVIPQPVGCTDPCSTKSVDLAVSLTLSGPQSAKSTLISMAKDLLSALEGGEFDSIFNGFPANATDTFTVTTV